VNKLLLLDADKPGEEIRFLINSPGGVVTSGMAIYDTMKMLRSPVSTVCVALAASMGSILLSGGAKGRRFIYPHAEVMIHQPSLGGYFQGVSVDLEIQAKQTKRVKDIGAKILAENCGKKSPAGYEILTATIGWMPKKPSNMALWISNSKNYELFPKNGRRAG
jgi:ATP-dependent Clp protease protease subunit